MSLTSTILAYASLAIVSTAVVWKGSEWLEGASEKLSAYYELPPWVQGAVVLAVGSSFPELSSAVLAVLLHGDFSLGTSAIVGSAIFNITVIPAVSAFAARETFSTNRDLVYKEAQFYIISVAVLLLVFSFAVIYNPVSGPGIRGEVTRGLAVIPVVAYALYLFMQWQDTMDHEPEAEPSEVRVGRQWALLALSLAGVLVGVEALVRAAVELGRILETPSLVWGATVVAVGTSLPDAFYSVRAARKGNAVTSTANVLGSNVFDLLVAVPAGVLIGGAVVVDFAASVPMFGVLTLVTILLFAFMRTRLVLSKWEAVSLLLLYGGFVGWIFVRVA
jgi:cation:H+ antiporter